MAGIDWWFALESRYSGLIPQITVLMGPCIAGQAYCPVLCDFLLMSRETAHLWLGGPRMTQAATSEKISDNVGGADYHMEYSGTCDVVGADDKETIAKADVTTEWSPALTDHMAREAEMARPERFELPTARFVVRQMLRNLLL